MVWIDCKKEYDIVPQRWIINCLKMFKISDEVTNFIEKKHEKMESRIDSRRKKLSRGKDPERYVPGRYIITITICNRDDAT